MMDSERRRWLLLSVLANGLFWIGVLGTGIVVKVWASDGLSFPGSSMWDSVAKVSQIVGPIVTGVVGWFLRSQVHELHVTFNSKMDKYVSVVEAAAEARGELKEGARRDTLAVAKAEGVIEGSKEKT